MSCEESKRATQPVRCGIVLAGGEGRRLQSFVYRFKGVNLPKQYVNFVGNRSMLEMAFERTEKLIFPDHLFTVVNQGHVQIPEVKRQVSSRLQGTVVRAAPKQRNRTRRLATADLPIQALSRVDRSSFPFRPFHRGRGSFHEPCGTRIPCGRVEPIAACPLGSGAE